MVFDFFKSDKPSQKQIDKLVKRLTEPSGEDEQRLLRSLDEAIRDVNAGKGVPIEDVRRLVPSWVAK